MRFWLGVTDNRWFDTIQVSKRIRDQWFNGKAYYQLDGRPLAVVPDEPDDRPNVEYLRWHNQRFAA